MLPDILKNQKIVVGVSGGRDSMALCHMLRHQGYKIIAVTVDHALRPESRSEAEKVGQWMQHWDIPHHILTWADKDKPTTGIMDAARQARYTLLTDFCTEHNCDTLAVAHHEDDQIETFFYRLTKGSGLDGLSGMDTETAFNNITVIRPLLNMSRQEITDYCQKNDIPFVDDPSNENEKYTRVRFRNFLESEGLDNKRISKTISRLSRASDALDDIASDVYLSLVTNTTDNQIRFKHNKWANYHLEVRIRIIQKIITHITGNYFGAQLAKIEDAIQILDKLPNGKSFALGGVLFTKSKNDIKAVKETR